MGHAVHEAVKQHLPDIAALCRQYGVERLHVSPMMWSSLVFSSAN